jgi:hypothetical protein
MDYGLERINKEKKLNGRWWKQEKERKKNINSCHDHQLMVQLKK